MASSGARAVHVARPSIPDPRMPKSGRVRHQAPRPQSPGLAGLGLGRAPVRATRAAAPRRAGSSGARNASAPCAVRAGGQRVVHQRRGVTGPGPGGLVAPGPAVPLPPQPPLAVQVLHDRHHEWCRPAAGRSCRASTISRTSTGRPRSPNRSMITASSSPKRRILTPEHGHANGAPAVTYYQLIEQPYGSGLPPFFRASPPAWPADGELVDRSGYR